MANQLVSLLVTFCVASTMVNCSLGWLPSLPASTPETIPEDYPFNTATLSDDLELTTSDASWATAVTDVVFSVDSTVPMLATTAKYVTSDASWATAAMETKLLTDNIVRFSVTTTERTAPDTIWATATTDVTHSTRTLGIWSAWSTCSSPCDGGVQSRVRVTEMTTNAEILEESEIDTSNLRLCNTDFCQVDFTEESYGVYIDLRTTLSTDQYVQVRDQIRTGVGWEIIRFCNSSDNFATCCAGQTLRAQQVRGQVLLDSIVVKRAALPQNDSAFMRLFLVVTANATLAICQRPVSSVTTAAHSAARRSAEKEQLYMAPAVLSRLLESGSLAQTITSTIESHFPNVTTVVVASRPGASAAWLPESSTVTSSTVKPCGALMELSQKDQQCIYSVVFYVAIASPSVALLIVLVAILSAYKLRRRRFQCTSRGGDGSSNGSRGPTQSISKAQTNSEQRRRYVHLPLCSRGLDAPQSIVKQDSLSQICDSSGNLNGIYENVTTFRSDSQACEPAVAATAANDAPQPRSLPLPECGAEDADVYVLPIDQPMNSVDLQQTIDMPLAWQQLATESAAVASGSAAARARSKRLTQGEYVYIATEEAGGRPAAAMPVAALPEGGEYNYAIRMSEIESDYANIVEGEHTVWHSVLADGNTYVAMG